MKNYGGAMLEDAEAEALEELEIIYKCPIPLLSNELVEKYIKREEKFKRERNGAIWKGPSQYGFFAEAGHVVMLYICGEIPRRNPDGNSSGIDAKHINLPENCRNLKYLSEFDVPLISVPKWLNEFHSMQRINLSDIRNPVTLSYLDFSNMKSLRYLALGLNRLKMIPDSIWELPSLEYLSIGGNYLTSVSEKICRLKSIRYLDLSGNRMTSIPDCIADFSNLAYFVIDQNRLPDLPEKFKKFLSKDNFTNGDIHDGNPIVVFFSDFGNVYNIVEDDDEEIKYDEIS